jgi:hypothetical protein
MIQNMKKVIIRALIVMWIFSIGSLVIFLFSEGFRDFPRFLMGVAFCTLPIWALQFILTGFVSPLLLLKNHSTERNN